MTVMGRKQKRTGLSPAMGFGCNLVGDSVFKYYWYWAYGHTMYVHST